jgi:RNA polymerase subunit RPABC4/transcription elongation factor Spt4
VPRMTTDKETRSYRWRLSMHEGAETAEGTVAAAGPLAAMEMARAEAFGGEEAQPDPDLEEVGRLEWWCLAGLTFLEVSEAPPRLAAVVVSGEADVDAMGRVYIYGDMPEQSDARWSKVEGVDERAGELAEALGLGSAATAEDWPELLGLVRTQTSAVDRRLEALEVPTIRVDEGQETCPECASRTDAVTFEGVQWIECTACAWHDSALGQRTDEILVETDRTQQLEALAVLLVAAAAAQVGGLGQVLGLSGEALAMLPSAVRLGMTPDGWRVTTMLMRAYLRLSPSLRAVVDGPHVGYDTQLWEMITGKVVTL